MGQSSILFYPEKPVTYTEKRGMIEPTVCGRIIPAPFGYGIHKVFVVILPQGANPFFKNADKILGSFFSEQRFGTSDSFVVHFQILLDLGKVPVFSM